MKLLYANLFDKICFNMFVLNIKLWLKCFRWFSLNSNVLIYVENAKSKFKIVFVDLRLVYWFLATIICGFTPISTKVLHVHSLLILKVLATANCVWHFKTPNSIKYHSHSCFCFDSPQVRRNIKVLVTCFGFLTHK